MRKNQIVALANHDLRPSLGHFLLYKNRELFAVETALGPLRSARRGLAISSRRVSSTHASSVSFGINLSGRARDATPAYDGLSTRPRPALAARRWAKPF